MLKIEEAVDGVLAAMRMQGFLESTLEHLKWSVYKPIVNYHHDNGTELCSDDLLNRMCEKQAARYEKEEISRKRYREFVTAAFRIRSYVDTGEVDFSIVKDTKYYKPGEEYQRLVDSVLKASGLTEGSQYRLAIIMRHFFCFFEKRHTSIKQATDRDFLDFIPEAAKKSPNNMTCTYCAKENRDSDFRSAKWKNSQRHCGIHFRRTTKVRRCPCFSAGISAVYGNQKYQPFGLYDK